MDAGSTAAYSCGSRIRIGDAAVTGTGRKRRRRIKLRRPTMIETTSRIAAITDVANELATLRGYDCDGNCPECGKVEGFNIRAVNMAGCRDHKVCWNLGINLYSGWRHQPEEIWQENAALLDTFKRIPISEAVYANGENQKKIQEMEIKLRALQAEHKERFSREVEDALAAVLQPLIWFEKITQRHGHNDGKFALAGRIAKAAREQLECISVVLDCDGVPEEPPF